jgi:hypothetical protein
MALVVLLVAAAACGDGGGGGDGKEGDEAATAASTTTEAPADATTTTAATTGTTAAGTTGASGATSRECPQVGSVPADAITAPVVDVDGDGERDEVWFSGEGTPRMGIATASGTVVGATIHSGKAPQAAVVVNADERGPVEMFAATGAEAFLLIFQNCDLVPVIGPDGLPYSFDLGYRGNGTGVTCTDADGDGRRDLVGVNFVDNGDGTAKLSRTVIELDGATATHGHHDERTVPGHEQDPENADHYIGVHCGPEALTPEMIGG